MKKQLRFIFLLSLLISIHALAGSTPPKREFRGAWIATVTNLDWPSSPNLTPEAQRNELICLLDELQASGVNAVVFQIRPECDAFYASSFEPWSYYLTGIQGQAPVPFYDPLEFATAEAHKRGMELHAWFNPYRAVRAVGSYPVDAKHVSVKHPDWVITMGTYKFLDPGIPMVRDYVNNVIMDVVRRYDIDGVHMDDYFYPYPPNQITNQDDKTFATYSRGFTNRDDWRRDNVNLLIKMVHDSIQVVKPHVKFGMSPFGIWKNGVPPGITGLDAYSTIYCDAVAWLNQQIIDYLTPQLYWPFGGGQDYGKLLPWWAAQTKGRHLYPGQAVYRISSWTAGEMPRQIRLNRNTPNVYGSIFFRALSLRDNPLGFVDSLKADYYRHPSLFPIMAWKDSVPPNFPQNLRYERLAGTGTAGLRWDLPATAADGDSASRYVVYRFATSSVSKSDLDDPSKIVSVIGGRIAMPKTPPAGSGPAYYVVTALDRNANESAMSSVLLVSPPATPLLASPANGALDQPASVTLRWYYPSNAASYQVQVSPDSTFATQLAVNESGIVDTFKVVAGLEGQQTYYWRVKASNAGGTSAFSNAYRFTTGFPAAPLLAYPANNTPSIPLNVTFKWNTSRTATSYHLQVARSLTFDSTAIVAEVKGITDTAYAVSQLEGNRFYFWRVRATNAIGVSNWSQIWRFKTIDVSAVAEVSELPAKYTLYQNYPNPFNPVTTIAFDLPNSGTAELVVYDMLGREMLRLANEPMAAGRHTVQFDASPLPSGVYYYRLKFEGRILTRKMTVLK
ncbi:MAG: family 10 glycosylhydrolase [candidate division KSB1 bacterium]|nr:family 10 glycosylhydrolase [candidate division KSB1 bacterium]MDZ7300943.1 family 10 glycosylhydrolase [candidate division KSB1 bacterium]MDZ7310379.1 family 10 glycosylhydrolase [candidate division KSB1 bacterium]